MASHPEVVIEKKRSARTTTISCRNRRSDAAGGTSCSWMLKATMKDHEDMPLQWVLSHESLHHNAACQSRMDTKLAEKGTLTSTKSTISGTAAHPKPRAASIKPVVPVKKRRIEISDDSDTGGITSDTEEEEEETPAELRKRKANHPGNVLPSRARRYKW